MTVKNKWNGKTYDFIEAKGNEVVLKREDGSVFTINKSEFFANYTDKGLDKVN